MATMKARRETENRTIAEQAVEWLMILEEDRQQDRVAFVHWLTRSPMHVDAILTVSAVETLIRQVDPEQEIQIDAGPFPEVEEITPFVNGATESGAQVTKPGSRRVLGWVALAASIAVLAVALLVVRAMPGTSWKHYDNPSNAQQVERFEEGSVMYLDPGSAVDVRFDATERGLRLVNGRATFKVHHDKALPFRVYSGKTVVQAVGTQFSVARVRDESLVSVTEGVVQMSREWTLFERVLGRIGMSDASSGGAVTLAAGLEARAAASGEILPPTRSMVSFNDATLFEIVKRFNESRGTLTFRVADEAAGRVRYGATLDPGNSEALLEVLLASRQLTVERVGSEVVIRSR